MEAAGAYILTETVRECVYNIRVSLLGDSDVGKTSISKAFRGKDVLLPETTIGCEFGLAFKKYPNGESVRYVIVDTAGQEKYSYMIPNFMKSCDAVVVVYDVTFRNSFESIDRWLSLVHTRLPFDVPAILVGNKCDKVDARDVYLEEGRKKAEAHNMFFIESSALTGQHIHNIFEHLSTAIRNRKLHELFNGAKSPLSHAAISLPRVHNSQDHEKRSCCS